MNVNPVNMRNADEIENAIENFARTPNGGLIVAAGGASRPSSRFDHRINRQVQTSRDLLRRFFVAGGGLISYGAKSNDQYQRAASDVDRILKGEKPADLPVQAPTKFSW